MTWLALATAAVWLCIVLVELRGVLELPVLPVRRADAALASATVVMAVRDDVQHVEASVRRLLAQRALDLHLVVVDDRSTDGTDRVLCALAAADPRLQVYTVRELPPDWLGKTHALHVGTAAAATPWLLFVDGDSQLAPDLVARAIDAANAAAADHVALLPAIAPTTWLGRASLLAFQCVVAERLRRVNTDRPRAFVGTGAFNLVRTAAYRAIGGHERLRLEVVDDVWLGALLLRNRFRSRLFLAPDDVVVDWGGTPRRLLRDVEKNMFAVMRYRTWIAVPLAIAGLALTLGAATGPVWGGVAGSCALAAFLLTTVPAILLARRMGWSVRDGLASPFGRFLLPLALLRSTLQTLRRGGVVWRGTLYPLAQLRAGQVR